MGTVGQHEVQMSFTSTRSISVPDWYFRDLLLAGPWLNKRLTGEDLT